MKIDSKLYLEHFVLPSYSRVAAKNNEGSAIGKVYLKVAYKRRTTQFKSYLVTDDVFTLSELDSTKKRLLKEEKRITEKSLMLFLDKCPNDFSFAGFKEIVEIGSKKFINVIDHQFRNFVVQKVIDHLMPNMQNDDKIFFGLLNALSYNLDEQKKTEEGNVYIDLPTYLLLLPRILTPESYSTFAPLAKIMELINAWAFQWNSKGDYVHLRLVDWKVDNLESSIRNYFTANNAKGEAEEAIAFINQKVFEMYQ
jgi:hypothetical protein